MTRRTALSRTLALSALLVTPFSWATAQAGLPSWACAQLAQTAAELTASIEKGAGASRQFTQLLTIQQITHQTTDRLEFINELGGEVHLHRRPDGIVTTAFY